MKNNYDIAQAMENILEPSFLQRKASNYNIQSALNNLVKAAELLDDLELHIASEAITKIIESVNSSLKE